MKVIDDDIYIYMCVCVYFIVNNFKVKRQTEAILYKQKEKCKHRGTRR